MLNTMKLRVLNFLLIFVCVVDVEQNPIESPSLDEGVLRYGDPCETDPHGIGLEERQINNNFTRSFCGITTCSGGTIRINSCPSILLTPGCKIIPVDLSTPFPGCCERAEC